MRKKIACALLVLLAVVSRTAPARDTLPMRAEPLAFERDGAAIGCGIRLTGGKVDPRQPSLWFDVSVNVFRGGIALAQAVAYEMPQSRGTGETRPSRLPLQSAWIKAGAGSAKLGENAERHDSLIYRLALDDAMSLFDAASQGKSVAIGLKAWDESRESVYEGEPALSGEGRERIAACVARLAE